ncbi:MAG TPA: carbon-nitrogen hydrolase [Polyangiaceae bacterium]|nr:carbon-nitrogen hydrolase [Polyangiaceae bacterium]
MASRRLKLALIQQRSGDQDSVHRAAHAVREAAIAGAQLVLLPELYHAPYFCQTADPTQFDLAEPLDGHAVRAMADVAAEMRVVVAVPFFERRAPGLCHNSMILLGPDGSRLGLYRKMHIPDDPQFEEKFYFTPGDTGFVPIDTPLVRVGPLICWDQWFPEAARLQALAGAELLLYPTAIGWLASEKAELGAAQLDAWKTMQRSHAIANGVFVVAVNRVGMESVGDRSIEFWGHSFVCDPRGVVIAEAGEQEETLIVEIELDLIAEQRRWWPFLRDRRIDAYQGLLRRYIDDVER